MCIFQSTHPGWGATPYKTDERYNSKFQSTHPGWGATLCAQSINNVPFYFNPRTPGGVRRYLLLYQQRTSDISIHAPRVGCDLPTQSLSIWTYPISIHAPRVGCDLLLRLSVQYKLQFQSTHPGWGATAKVHKRRNGFYVLLRIFFHLYVKTVIFGAMLVCKPGKNLA